MAPHKRIKRIPVDPGEWWKLKLSASNAFVTKMNEHEFKSQRRSSFAKQHTYANIHLQRVEAANQASAEAVHCIKVTDRHSARV